MKKISIFLAMLGICFSIIGCSPRLKEGEVYEKEFKPAYSTLIFIPLTICNGKTTTTTIVPFTYFYPDRWIIRIKAFNSGEWETAKYWVSKEVYDTVNIGDQFEYQEGRDLTEEPYTRERKESG